MSQEDLAQLIGCAYETVRKIETGARRPSIQVAELLGITFKVPPEQLPAFVEFARQEGNSEQTIPVPSFITEASPATKNPFLSTLPTERTTFVGRTSELEGVRTLLLSSSVRLLTLMGPPGTGKTRLSTKVAASLQSDFEDGIYFVSLAALSDPEKVPAAIGRALGLNDELPERALDSLRQQLQERSSLLVLDNFEQLVAAGPYLGQLLEACPALKMLVTSRTVLNIYGEHQFYLRPMEVPVPGVEFRLEELRHFEAIDLFVQRARSQVSNFVLTEANAAAVGQICRQLDGLPLAIELAAALCKLLPPQHILQRLTKRLVLLTHGPHDLPRRQQTLRNAIGWSYGLLNEHEAALFRRLAVFADSCALDAVEAICNLPGETEVGSLNTILALIDRSLVVRADDPDTQPRFSMLKTVREYAEEQLDKQDELALLHRQHANYFLALAEQAEPYLKSGTRELWLQRLENEHDNLRAALDWYLSYPEGIEAGLRLAGALHWFWFFHGYLSEGREWLEKALRRAADLPDSEPKAKVMSASGWLALLQDDYDVTFARLNESVEAWRKLGDERGLAYALSDLGIATAYRYRRESSTGLQALEEAVGLFRKVDDKWGLARALNWLGDATILLQSDEMGATACMTESLQLYRQLNDRWGISHQLSELGHAALRQGNHALARTRLNEALNTGGFGKEKWSAAHTLRGLGDVALYDGDYVQATLLYEESLAVYRELGDRFRASTCLRNLAGVHVLEDDYEGALSLYKESLSLAQALGHVPNIALCLVGLSAVALGEGDSRRASTLLWWSDRLRQMSGGILPPADRLIYSRNRTVIGEPLGEEAFGQAVDDGGTTTLEKALAYAFG